jgi:hypothetical protein
MKSINLKILAADDRGEYVFGSADTGSHACYMIYGTMKPGEKGREVRPGRGHEEMVLAARGSFSVTGDIAGTLEEGAVFHLAGEQTCFLENRGDIDAVYIIAGGHSAHGHGH